MRAWCELGYNNLVSDMRSLMVMRETGCPVVYDATHSCNCLAGRARRAAVSANSCRCSRAAAVASGIAGVFMETPPDLRRRCRTAPMRGPLQHMRALLETLKALDALVKRQPLAENLVT